MGRVGSVVVIVVKFGVDVSQDLGAEWVVGGVGVSDAPYVLSRVGLSLSFGGRGYSVEVNCCYRRWAVVFRDA